MACCLCGCFPQLPRVATWLGSGGSTLPWKEPVARVCLRGGKVESKPGFVIVVIVFCELKSKSSSEMSLGLYQYFPILVLIEELS